MRINETTFSISQVSQKTGISKNRIRDWCDKRYMPETHWIEVGQRRHRRFTEKDIRLLKTINQYLTEGYVLPVASVKAQSDLLREE